MNKTIFALASTALALSAVPPAAAGSFIQPPEENLRGTLSGRVQLLAMSRDYDDGLNGSNATLGTVLGYTSPQIGRFDFGAAYNYAFTLFRDGESRILLNDDINVLNEGWLRFRPGGAWLEGTSISAGRMISNGEVFRADDYRQKARATESVQITSNAIAGLALTAGHAIRLSNWIDLNDCWDFNNFGDVFRTGYATDGVTWIDGLYTGFENWEIGFFNAYAWDVTNLTGTRVQYQLCEDASIIACYRHEGNVGRAGDQDADAFGISWRQQVGKVTLEPGYFGVFGDSLRFQEATTGINHPLGASMLICACQFAGGAQTAYLKASGKVGETALYLLYNYTWQTDAPAGADFDGQELNVVINQPITENLSVAFKGGLGYEDGKSGQGSRTLSDARLFLTCGF